MKAPAVLSDAMRFLAEKILPTQAPMTEGSLPADGSPAELPAAVIRSAGELLQAQLGQPVMVRLGPMLAFLAMLRQRQRRNRPRGQDPGLPPGCVMLVRYRSR